MKILFDYTRFGVSLNIKNRSHQLPENGVAGEP